MIPIIAPNDCTIKAKKEKKKYWQSWAAELQSAVLYNKDPLCPPLRHITAQFQKNHFFHCLFMLK